MDKYLEFPGKELISDWEKLIKLERKEVVELLREWEEIEEINSKISKDNYKKKWEELDEIGSFLGKRGVSIRKKNGRGFLKWFEVNILSELDGEYPVYRDSLPVAHMWEREVNGKLIKNNQSPTSLVEIYDKVKAQYREMVQYDKDKYDKLAKSIEFAVKRGIDVTGARKTDIVNLVDDILVRDYRKKELPEGTVLELNGGCDFCREYIVGEDRCSCGNRRIFVAVEGDIIQGYDYSIEVY